MILSVTALILTLIPVVQMYTVTPALPSAVKEIRIKYVEQQTIFSKKCLASIEPVRLVRGDQNVRIAVLENVEPMKDVIIMEHVWAFVNGVKDQTLNLVVHPSFQVISLLNV